MTQTPIKNNLHPRNRHRGRYHFPELISVCPELKSFVTVNAYNDESIDFADPEAVKCLNRAILSFFYGVKHWDIPQYNLCPPIPGRADYLHYAADLLGKTYYVESPPRSGIRVLDIGVGANCVYPLIGHHEYGWSFVGSDVDPHSLESAQKILDSNPDFKQHIELRKQSSTQHIFEGIILDEDFFDLTICNPPFHSSLEEAQMGTQRKWKNLGKDLSEKKGVLNFGGKGQELWYEGGEAAFIKLMIHESALKGSQCLWFSTLVSKKETLPALYQELRKVKAVDVKTVDMAQGQKISRFVAWTFLNQGQQKEWIQS